MKNLKRRRPLAPRIPTKARPSTSAQRQARRTRPMRRPLAARISDKGKTKQVVAAPAGSPKIPADAPAAGGKDSDTGTTEHIGAAPAESLEIQANTYTREVAQWLTSLTSKALERGVFLPTILIEMCPLTTETRQNILDLVPWLPSAGYTTMLRREVKSKAKGALHVSSIHFGSMGFTEGDVCHRRDCVAPAV